MARILVLTTVPSLKFARSIARYLIENKLAACVSVKPGWTSVYRWKGKIEKSSEALLMIKTSRGRFGRIQKAVKRMHPYEIPEMISLAIAGGSADYLRWMTHALK